MAETIFTVTGPRNPIQFLPTLIKCSLTGVMG